MMGVSTVPIGTDAIISTGRVITIRSIATHLSSLGALVDVSTGAIRLRAIALGTGAIAEASCDRNAFGALGTLATLVAAGQDALAADKLVRRLALALQTAALVTAHIRISVEAGRTMALVATGQILAQRISSARLLAILRTLVHVATLLRGLVPHETLSADANVRAQVRVLHARLSRRTRVVIAARDVHDIVLGTTIAIRIT